MTLSDTPNPGGKRISEVNTIRHLVDAVGSPVLQVLAAPRRLDLRVRSTVLHDPVDELEFEPDAVLLMAGLRAGSPAAIDIVRKTGCLGRFAFDAVSRVVAPSCASPRRHRQFASSASDLSLQCNAPPERTSWCTRMQR